MIALSLLAMAVVCGCAFAQETWGTVRGTVTDPSGAAVPGAKVELSGGTLPRALTTTTGAAGEYTFAQVPAGTGYQALVTNQGFRNARIGGVNVELGKASTIDVRLEVGQVSETVEVSADAAMVDTQSSSSAVTVDRSFFDTLPKGRSFYDLIGIAPGARNEGKSGGFEVDGASGSENTFYLDGVEVTSIQQGTLSTQNRIPVEAIQQVQIKNGVMEAQYGGAMGGVVNAVVRSGTNDWHGQLGFYFNNDVMQARPRPVLRLDPNDENVAQYIQQGSTGFPFNSYSTWNPLLSAGGPILRNRLFLFSSYMPTVTTTDRLVDFTTGDTGTYHQRDAQQYLANKVDFTPFTKLRLNMSWVWNPDRVTGLLPTWQGTDSPSAPWGQQGNRRAGNILAGQIDYLATNNLIVSFRGGYTYTNYNDMYSTPTYTAIYYSGASTTVPPADLQGSNGWIQQPTSANLFDFYTRKNFSADASYMANWHGQHNIKGGWQANLLSDSVAASSYANGYYRYYWGSSYTCVTSQCAGKQTGTYGYYRYRVYGTYGDASSSNHAIYLQDNWRVNSRLTLNLGLRTEREYLPSFSTANSTAAPPIEFSWTKKMSPRVGFALDIKGDGRQKLFGSFGYFYDTMKYEMPRGSFGGDVWQEWYYALDDPSLVNRLNGVPADPYKLPGKFFEFVNWRIPSNDPSTHLVDPNLMPMAQRMFDIGYDYSIRPELVASIRYTNRRLLHTIEDTGYIDPDAGETYLITNPGFGMTQDQAFWTAKMGAGVPVTYKARRDYDAVEFRLDRRFAKNYQFSGSYTWSRLYGNYSGLASSDENGRTSPNVNRYFDMPWVGYDQTGHVANGLLATDRPHTFKLFGTYTKSSKLGQTMIAPNIQLYSGAPITTEANVVSTTPMFVFGRGDLGRTPVFFNTDLNFSQDFMPFKAHESMRLRFEFTVFNLFNSATVTDRFKQIIHSSDGQLQFQNADGSDNYGAIFRGFDTLALMQAQGDRTDPQYKLPTAFQGPRSLRLQLSFFF
jgi:Carboxypeptidase regulatory-like domain/TonB-dependent Receptor Plug Domain